jgi:hypothetical protein
MNTARSAMNVESSSTHSDVVTTADFVVKSFAVGVVMKSFQDIKLATQVIHHFQDALIL